MKTILQHRLPARAFSTGALLVAASAILIAGCSTTSSGSADNSYQTDGGYAVNDSVANESTEMASADMEQGSSGATVENTIITSGDATVFTNDPVGTSKGFQGYVTEIGGRIDSVWTSDSEPQVSSVFVSIPADQYETALAELASFGRILNQSTSRQDVGMQLADLNGRRDSLVASIERLEDLMAQAATTEELLQAEDMLTQRRSELDSLDSQLTWLSDQVEMSTLSVTFTDSKVDSQNFWVKAWDLFLQSVQVVAYSLVVLIPWAILIAPLVWLALILVRKISKKRSKKTLTEDSGTNPDSVEQEDR